MRLSRTSFSTLDVYKRQPYNQADVSVATTLYQSYFSSGPIPANAPVDVYKRQRLVGAFDLKQFRADLQKDAESPLIMQRELAQSVLEQLHRLQ